MRTIGVLGGIGPQATTDFIDRVHQISQRMIPQHGNMGYPPLLVYYHRRAPLVTEDGFTAALPVRIDPLLLEAARRLGAAADFLVITSNGAHMFQEPIEQAAGRKVVSMIEATLAEVERRQLKRVGVLTLFEPRVYQVPLTQRGIACEIITDDLQKRLNQAIWAVMEGRAAETHAVAREAVAALRAGHVEAILLGCTEIPFMLPESDNDPTLINPLQLLAEAAVRAAMEEL